MAPKIAAKPTPVVATAPAEVPTENAVIVPPTPTVDAAPTIELTSDQIQAPDAIAPIVLEDEEESLSVAMPTDPFCTLVATQAFSSSICGRDYSAKTAGTILHEVPTGDAGMLVGFGYAYLRG